MNVSIELWGGPRDGHQFTILAVAAKEWPPQAIYVPRHGDPEFIAGPLAERSEVATTGYAVYRRAGRATADRREVYDYQWRELISEGTP
jgi:hypothetical protein